MESFEFPLGPPDQEIIDAISSWDFVTWYR